MMLGAYYLLATLAGLQWFAVEGASQVSWVSLPLDAPQQLSDDQSDPLHYVDVFVGSANHLSSLAVSLGDYLSVIMAAQCFFCPGTDLYDPTQSTTVEAPDSSGFSHDTITFGGVSTPASPFILVDTYPVNESFHGGILGMWFDPSNTTMQQDNIFKKHLIENELLNPVVGFRFGPPNAKMTVGALDQADYEGVLNWVPATGVSQVNIDGFYGKNGSRIPYITPLKADLSSVTVDLFLPSPLLYFENPGYTGVQMSQIVRDGDAMPGTPEYAYICNDTSNIPTVNISVSINGVQYPVNSHDLLKPQSPLFGTCIVGIGNHTNITGDGAGATLGLPFLRSVYLAYRFPTGDCPAYYGFAFPSGANITANVISQKPTTTLSVSDVQCLSFTPPNSKPLPPPEPEATSNSGGYAVYGRPGDGQVQLIGFDALGSPRVWDGVKP